MHQGIVDRLNPVLVLIGIGNIVTATDRMRRFNPKLLFQRLHKCLDQIHIHALGIANDRGQFRFHQRGKNDRPLAVQSKRLIDFTQRIISFVDVIDKRKAYLFKAQIELGQDSMTECLRRNPCAIRNEKNSPVKRTLG